jgi:hypothetical protein
MVQELEKMKKVSLIFPLTWEHKIINGDLYFVQGVLPNGKVLVAKTMSEQEFKSLFN